MSGGPCRLFVFWSPSALDLTSNLRFVLDMTDEFYVSPSGSDSADGTSFATAWKTLDFSLSSIPSSSSIPNVLNLLPGDYTWNSYYNLPVSLFGLEADEIRIQLSGSASFRSAIEVDWANLTFTGATSAYQFALFYGNTILSNILVDSVSFQLEFFFAVRSGHRHPDSSHLGELHLR